MKTVSNAFTAKMKETLRTWIPRMTINGVEVEGDIQAGLTINIGSCGAEQFAIGAMYVPYITAAITNCNTMIQDQEIFLEMGLKLDDGTVEHIPIGYFTASSVKKEKYHVAIEGYGRLMSRGGGLYVSDLTWPAKVSDVITEISNKMGVPIRVLNVDTSGTINVPMLGLMYREAIQYIAGLLGGYSTEDSAGNIVIAKYELNESVSVDTDFCYAFPSKNDTEYEVTGIEVVVSADSTDEEGNVTEGEKYTCDSLINVVASNPYINESLFEKCKANVLGFKYMPATTNFLGDLRIEPWDYINVTDDGETIVVPCMSVTHTWDGGVVTVVTAPGASSSEIEMAYGGPLSVKVERTYQELLTAKKIIASKITAEEADFRYASVANLAATDAKIASVSGEFLNFKNGEFQSLKASAITTTGLYAAVLNAGFMTVLDAELSFATIGSLEAAKADINNLTAKAITTDNLEAKVAEFDYITVENADIKYATIHQLEVVEEEIVDTLEANYATINSLNATNATVQTISGEFAAFKTGEFQSLQTTVADIGKAYIDTARVEELIANKGFITRLETNTLLSEYVETETLTANYITATEIDTKYATINSLSAKEAEIKNLFSNYVKAETLAADYIKAKDIDAKYATIVSLNATNASIQTLSGDFATFKNGAFHTLQANVANIESAYMDEAAVNTLVVNKGYITGLAVETLIADYVETETLEADYISAKDIESKYATIKNLEATTVEVRTLSGNHATFQTTVTNKFSAYDANISNLQATDAEIQKITSKAITTDTVDAEVAKVGYLKVETANANYATISNLNALNATVTNLSGKAITTENLSANVATLGYLKANALEAEVGTFGYLKAADAVLTYATITDLNTANATINSLGTKYATIDLANVKAGSITSAMIGDGVVGTAQIADGSITDAKIVGLTANKITAGRLDAGVIEVVNLNAANITVGTINGQQIASGAIDTTKLTNSLNSTINSASTNASNALTNASNAQNAAIAASELATLNYQKVTSKGEQLIVNGNGMIGDNTNFSSWTFDGTVGNNSPGSFTRPAGSSGTLYSDEYFLVSTNNTYTFSFDVKSLLGKGTMYSFLMFYDIDKNTITAPNHMFHPGTTTTLAKDLKAGDTVIYLTDASKWSTSVSYGFYLTVWNYKNSKGYTYPPESYTRNRVTLPKTSSNTLDSSKIDYTANTITLTSAYSGSTIPAGTYVSQGRDGGTYKYMPIGGTVIPTDWTTYSGKMIGVDYSGTNANNKFPPGVAYARIGFLWNYNKASGEQQWITNITVTDTTVSDRAQTTADGKNTVFYQASAPSTSGRKINDVWFDTDDGNRMHYWNGSAWAAQQFSTNAIAANAITSEKIVSEAITAAKIAANTITANQIASGAISTDELAANAVTAAKISAGAITTEKISTGAIVANSLAANAITSDKIIAEAITTAKLAAEAVTANKILAGTITSTQLDVNEIFANTANLGKIVASQTFSDAISAHSLVVSANNTANNALSQANSVKNSLSNYQLKAIPDTRNDNQTPEWYLKNYPKQQIVEFKYCNVIGLSGKGETYCSLTTTTPWGDSSGGFPKQTARIAGKEYWRVGTSATEWGSWNDAFGTATAANNLAASVNSVIGLWCYQTDTTYIDGGKIYTGTIEASQIAANAITSTKIAADAVTSDKINVSALSAITANLGIISAGVIQSQNYTESDYSVGEDGTFVGSVLSGIKIDLNEQGYYTPQIAIKDDYIKVRGFLTVGERNTNAADGLNVIGKYSLAVGYNVTASGKYSMAVGADCRAYGDSSFATGCATAEGWLAFATGFYSNAEGNYSHAEGNTTTAKGVASHAEGISTRATGNRSHAEGEWTSAIGDNSHAEGLETDARGYCQHVQGRYNIVDNEGVYAHIVGNGTGPYDESNGSSGYVNEARSNAYTLDWEGNAWFAGSVSAKGGTLTGELLFSTGTTQSATKGIKWSAINSKNPFIGYATDQVDGTFVVGSLLGTNYASGLAIGGGSGNLLWKGIKVATVNDNVATATKLATARTISLTGSVTGSGTFDGSGNLSITTTTNHSHTLDYRLQAAQSTATGSDANSATSTGFHYINGTTNRPAFNQNNGVTGNDYRILTTAYSASWLQQIATDFRCDDIFYRRNQNGSWQSWRRIAFVDECAAASHTHSYLPLTGGTLSGILNISSDRAQINLRPGHASYDGVISYQTSGNEAMVFSTKQAVTSFMFVNGEDTISNIGSARWQSLKPGLQIKNNCVSIGKLIANGVTPSYTLDVGGTIYASGNVTAPTFVGSLSGNATTATKATNDGDGRKISRFYCSMIPAGTSIPANADLNTTDYLKVGNYYCSQNTNAATLKNSPLSVAFSMQVFNPLSTTVDNETTDTWVYRLRKITCYNTGVEYIQYCYAGATANSWSYGNWYVVPRSKYTLDETDTNGGSATVGSAKNPVYVASDGTLTACSYTLGAACAKDVDTTAKSGSANLITSGAMYTALAGKAASSHIHSNIYNSDGEGYVNITISSGQYYFKPGAATNVTTPEFKVNCGGTNYRWQTVYAVNALNSSSDLRLKKDISNNLDKYIKLMDNIKPITFIRTNSDENRRHVGYGAQDVEKALRTVGLTNDDFAGLSKDWNEEKQDYTYGLTYEEFIPILHARQNRDRREFFEHLSILKAELRYVHQKLNAALDKIAAQEKEIEQLKLAS